MIFWLRDLKGINYFACEYYKTYDGWDVYSYMYVKNIVNKLEELKIVNPFLYLKWKSIINSKTLEGFRGWFWEQAMSDKDLRQDYKTNEDKMYAIIQNKLKEIAQDMNLKLIID